MLGFINLLAIIFTTIAVITLLTDKQYKVKLITGTFCVCAGIFVILAHTLPQKFKNEYISYSAVWKAGCIEYRKEKCQEVPLYFDKCRVVKSEIIYTHPPDWFYNEQ